MGTIIRDRVAELKAEKRINPSYNGYQYELSNNVRMFEYHLDDITDRHTLPELASAAHGGLLSVRKPEGSKEVRLWGHDEVVANAKVMPIICWNGSKGQQPMFPKDIGSPQHNSALVCEQVGWNPRPSPEQLIIINANRRGTKYIADEQAIRLYGTAEKQDLTADNEIFQW